VSSQGSPIRPARSLLVALPACTWSGEPTIDVAVVDLWGGAVPGVVVEVVEGPPPPVPLVTGWRGVASLPLAPAVTLRVSGAGWLGREVVVRPADGVARHVEQVELVPEPTEPGFHAVGPGGYARLGPEGVRLAGNAVRSFVGVASASGVVLPAGTLKVVFHTPLRRDEVARLDLALHRLRFVEQAEVGTVDGPRVIDVGLWVSDGEVAFDRVQLGEGGENYAFRAEALAPGAYAFVSMDLLAPRLPADFERIALELRVVHPFTLAAR
jgi:hypothetical protein